MSKCYICGCDISKENESEEHIFLNSIGGNLRSKDLICVICNSEFGNKIDAALSKQLNIFANMLNIERDRGVPQPFNVIDKKNDTLYSYEPGGKPKMIKPQIKKGNNEYKIVCSDIKQAKQILNGLKRKHPQIDVDEVLEKSEKKKEYIDNHVAANICLGGNKEFRAICKIAMNYYLYAGGNCDYIKHLIPYIKCETDSETNVSPIYLDNEPIKKNNNDILHSIIVIGRKNEKLLYAYIELFGFYKVIVLLNKNYYGDDIIYSYFFDVITRAEVQREYTLEISKDEISNVLNKNELPIDQMSAEINQFMKKVFDKQNKDHIDELLNNALENSLKKYPEGEIITEEMHKELINETMKQITPWLLHNLKDK